MKMKCVDYWRFLQIRKGERRHDITLIAMQFKYITISLFVISLQACATNSESPFERGPAFSGTVPLASVESTETDAAQTANGLNKVKEGDTVFFRTGKLEQFGKVTIGREYTAASGKLCKQLYESSGEKMIGIACKANDDYWYTRLSS